MQFVFIELKKAQDKVQREDLELYRKILSCRVIFLRAVRDTYWEQHDSKELHSIDNGLEVMF